MWIYCFLCSDDFGINFVINTAGFHLHKKKKGRKEALQHCQILTDLLLNLPIGTSDDKNKNRSIWQNNY